MIIGVTHDHDGRVVQRLSVSTKLSIGLPEIATTPPSSTTSVSCARRSQPTGSSGKPIRSCPGIMASSAANSTSC